MIAKSHSPGPFAISQVTIGESFGGFIEDSDGRLVAQLCTSIDDEFVRCAPRSCRAGNLTLLAASWDLLKATRAAVEFLDDQAMIERLRRVLETGGDADGERQSLLGSLRNAIAKAEQGDESLVWEVDYPIDDEFLGDGGESNAANRQ